MYPATLVHLQAYTSSLRLAVSAVYTKYGSCANISLDIIASEIPEQKKTSYRRKITREVCIRCNLDNIKRSLEWKNHNAKISWLDVLSQYVRMFRLNTITNY